MKTLLLYRTVVIELCWIGKVSSSSCQVYPSEYAYRSSSLYRSERASANCRRYPQSGNVDSIRQEDYTHCDGTPLRLTDSDHGSEQYSSSDYYKWSAGLSGRQLLFIVPTRVNLTTITLHYYSDSVRGLPRLRFFAVPDDFDVWDVPIASYSRVVVAALPPDGEPAGRRNISTEVNFSTKKVLMYKYSSVFAFAVSEVEFFFDCTSTTTYSTMMKSFTTPVHVATFTKSTAVTQAKARTLEPTTEYSKERVNTLSVSLSEVVAWVLVSILTVLFTGLLTVIVLWLYKKRQSRDIDERAPKYEIEGNPCYEATAVKQTTDVETHVYEAVKGGGAK